MANCCNPAGYERMFGPWFARRMAKRYRKRGTDKTARRIVELAAQSGVEGATVLEIGGGVGEIQLELLKRGAAHATSLELSAAYEALAQQLLDEAGLAGRAERRLVDIANNPDAADVADIVVMHRVVCCYPDYYKLLTAAAQHARQRLLFSYPPRNVVSRAAVACQNLLFRLRGSDFRVFVHPPAAMLAVVAEHGLHRVDSAKAFLWRIAAFER